MLRWSAGRGFIQRLSEIDTTGLPQQEQLSAELMLRSLIDDQEGAKFKEWQMPVNQFGGFHTELPQIGRESCVRDGEGLRRLHCAAEEGSDGILADHDEHAAGHGRGPRCRRSICWRRCWCRRRRWRIRSRRRVRLRAAEEVSEDDKRGGAEADLRASCWMRLRRRCCRRTSGSRSF